MGHGDLREGGRGRPVGTPPAHARAHRSLQSVAPASEILQELLVLPPGRGRRASQEHNSTELIRTTGATTAADPRQDEVADTARGTYVREQFREQIEHN